MQLGIGAGNAQVLGGSCSRNDVVQKSTNGAEGLILCKAGTWVQSGAGSGLTSDEQAMLAALRTAQTAGGACTSTSQRIALAADGSLLTCTSNVWTAAGGSGAGDITPTAFDFNDQTVEVGATATSNTVTVSGLGTNLKALATVTGAGTPLISLNGGAYTSTNQYVTNGDTLTLRMTASGSPFTAQSATATVGSLSDSWTVTTNNLDITPDAVDIDFAWASSVPSFWTTNAPAITGITGPITVAIQSGTAQLSVNGGAWAASGSLTNGQTLQVRASSAANAGQLIVLQIGTATVNLRQPYGGASIAVYDASTGWQSWTVPAGVYHVYFKQWGAGGGGAANSDYCSPFGGGGGFVSGGFDVTPGQVLYLAVGTGGSNTGWSAVGGAFGGATGGTGGNGYRQAGGGGMAAILLAQSLSQPNAIATAGGGGGSGGDCFSYGGGGGDHGYSYTGGYNGPSTGKSGNSGGAGGVSAANGAAGSPMQGGAGANSGEADRGGGGGGGGYLGGGGGGGGGGAHNGGGGGGRNYAAPGVRRVTMTVGTVTTPANNNDPDRSNAGVGGGGENRGWIASTGGRVLLMW